MNRFLVNSNPGYFERKHHTDIYFMRTVSHLCDNCCIATKKWPCFIWTQYAAGGHWPTDLEIIISDCLQYNTIASSHPPPPQKKYKVQIKFSEHVTENLLQGSMYCEKLEGFSSISTTAYTDEEVTDLLYKSLSILIYSLQQLRETNARGNIGHIFRGPYHRKLYKQLPIFSTFNTINTKHHNEARSQATSTHFQTSQIISIIFIL
jgi:hypothetical protein